MLPKFILDVLETGDLPKVHTVLASPQYVFVCLDTPAGCVRASWQLSESTMGDEGQEVGGDLLTPEEWRQLMEMYSAGEGEQPPQECTQIAIKLVKVRTLMQLVATTHHPPHSLVSPLRRVAEVRAAPWPL